MRKAYRVTGSTFTKPENLPEGLTVKERFVGDITSTSEFVFHEVKDGSVVIYRQGVPNSNAKVSYEELETVWRFLLKVWQDHYPQTKCPGTPHRGHASSDWSCPLDRA